jgi:lipopolysaccharide cholinephosphotransferase
MKHSGLNTMTDEDIKQSLLETFKDIKSFFEENNLMYCMAYGTLLGAIRHKGFIPWDLDMDINMPRPDFEYFIKNFVSKNKQTKIVDSKTNSNFFMSFAKLSDSRTICDEHYRGFKEDLYGVSVDVFPIDGIDEKKYPRTLSSANILTNILYANRIKPNRMVTLNYNIGFIISNIAFAWWPYKKIVRRIDKLCANTDYDKVEMVAGISDGNPIKLTFSKEYFEDLSWGEFEGIKCRIPTHYDEILTKYYGDYMTPLPENKRVDQHTYSLYYWK